MSYQLDGIESEIVTCVGKVVSALHARRTSGECLRIGAWTSAILEALRELGIDKSRTRADESFLVWPSPKEPASNAWLFDMCWARCPGGKWQAMNGLALACEIEWKTHDDYLLEDFLKLTVVVADHRLFVFDMVDDGEEQFQLLQTACPADQKFRYLAIGVHDKTGTIQARNWIC